MRISESEDLEVSLRSRSGRFRPENLPGIPSAVWVRVLTVCSDPRKGGRKKPSRQIGGSAFFDHLFEPWKRWSKKAEPPHWRLGFFRPPFCTQSREIPAPADELSEAYLRARPLWTGRHLWTGLSGPAGRHASVALSTDPKVADFDPKICQAYRRQSAVGVH